MEALGVNLGLFLAQLITFLIVIFVLQRFAFPLVIKTLDNRERTIRQGVEDSVKAREQLAEAEKRVQAMLDHARQEGQETLARANQAAERLRAEIEQQARDQSRDILAQAEVRIQQEMAQARTELGKQVADLAILAAERVVGHSLDTEDNRRLVNEFVAQSRELQ